MAGSMQWNLLPNVLLRQVVLSYLFFCQLFQAAVICTQYLQTMVDWLSEGLQDTLAQSSLNYVLCRSA